MKTHMRIFPVIMLCIFMLAETTALGQQGNEKGKSTVKKEKKQNDALKQETDDTENDVIKKANDMDVEETEKDNTKAIDRSLPEGQKKIKPAKETDEEAGGNAYGKEKGDLKGREFGQIRAEQAKVNHGEKSQELNESLNQGDQKVKEARIKIEEAKVKLETDKKSKRISETEYKQKKEKIVKAEEAVDELEKKVNEGKRIEKPESMTAVENVE